MLKKYMFLFLLVAILFFPLEVEGQTLPQPDANGDYWNRCSYWKVVDSDPAGLNGRYSSKFPKNFCDWGIEWPLMDILNWPVVAVFPHGYILTAQPGNVTAYLLSDDRGKPWLIVMMSPGEFCFVRANEKFIKPISVYEYLIIY